MSEHTPGPWCVVVNNHPHWMGGAHIERRIFTEWEHPQLKGPMGVVNSSVGIGEEKGGKAKHMVCISEADACLIAAAPDMLDALRKAVVLLAGACVHSPELLPHEAYEAVSAAIAKATGANHEQD